MKAFLSIAALSGLVMLAGDNRATAAVTYSYTGVSFTNYFGIDDASTQSQIRASVTFASAIGNSLSNANLIPQAWQISDGSLTLTNLSPNLTAGTQFIFSTNGSGSITAASIQVQQTWAQPINGRPGWNFLATNTSLDQTAYCYGSDLNSGCVPLYGKAYVIFGNTTTTPQPAWTSKVVSFTTMSLASSVNPSTFGQNVTLTATVTPSTATGTVTFTDGPATLGTSTLTAGTAVLVLSALTLGAHSLTAVYGGDTNDIASTSSVLIQTVLTPTPQSITFVPLSNRALGTVPFALSATASSGLSVTFTSNSTAVCTVSGLTITLVAAGTCSITASQSGNSIYAAAPPVTQTFTVTQAATTTSLTSSANPSTFGQNVTLTATVTPSTATGTVTFKDAATILSTVALSGGTAVLSISSLISGPHSLTATYGGDANDASSASAALTQQINRAVSTVALNSSLNPSTFGVSVVLTATVLPATATGTVTFLDGASTLGTGALSSGRAAFSSSSLSVGAHSLTASYAGDLNNTTSISSAVAQTVKQIVTTIFLTSSANPSTLGQSVNLTATVSPASATGVVTFKDGAETLGSSSLTGGTATFGTAGLAVGPHAITATYGGDANFATSSTALLAQTVNQPVIQAVTTTTLSSSANPSFFGQSVALTATVTPSIATGTVTFKDGATTLGAATLSSGTASLVLSTLTVGSHSLIAVYGGDTNDTSGTSSVLTQTVKPRATVQPRVGGLLTCANSTLAGPYGYAISGLLSTSGKLTPFADHGLFVADGKGSFVGSTIASTGGTVTSRTLSGSYSISGNCTGTAAFTDSLGNVLHVSLTVVNNGNEIQFVQTDSGTVISGKAQTAPTGCDSSAVSGSYTYAIRGWLSATGSYQPFADGGRIVADGSGNLTGKSSFSASGTTATRTFSGNYSVANNCTGTVTLTDSLGNANTLAITVVSGGKQVLFIETDSGTIISGGAQRGQFSCSNGSLAGSYSYALDGHNIGGSGGIVPVADSGLLASDGNGHFSGSDSISIGGTIASRTLTGSYTINADCTGSATFRDTLGNSVSLDVFVANAGETVQFIETDTGTVISGSAQQHRGTCTTATLKGPYGYAIGGWIIDSSVVPFVDSGLLSSDGAGRLSGASTVSANGTIVRRTLTGSYQMNTDCGGSASLRDSAGNMSNLRITASGDGKHVAFIETDGGTIISGSAKQQLAGQADGIVSAASFSPGAVVPGSLFAIFGSDLASEAAIAATLPWPTQLGGSSVSVNGVAAALYYVGPGQINAQLPLEIPPGPAQLVVSSGGLSSTAISFTVANAGPGIFTYGLLHAIAVNPDASLNGPASPARSGDTIVVYLTGGGPVNPSAGWISGAASPLGLSRVALPFTVTIGGQPASVDYLGLTPTSVGLYQLNVRVPALPPGDHPLLVTVGGNGGDGALISVAP